MSNKDTLDYRIYTVRSETYKAIHTLKGLLLGINLDGEVNEKEINVLNNWVEQHKNLINKNPFNEFMNIIQEQTKNNIPTKEAIEDLYWLCQKYEGDSYYYNVVTTDIQTLQGLCHGILSDGIINEKEILDLNSWLQNNEHLSSYYPYDELRSLILSILSDGKIDQDEKLILMAYFKQFVQIQDQELDSKISQDIKDIQISGLCTSDPQVDFDGKCFCVTGVLNRGNRKELENRIKDLGGIVAESVSKKTDYLIVGDNGNPAWAFACYGRKVEKAINYRKEGHTIMLIHEYDFFDILDDLS